MLTCKKCGYEWEPRSATRPVSCPECKSRRWDREEKKAQAKVMELVDPRTGQMKCKVCGATHFASIKPMSGGVFYRASWQCVNKCNPDELPKKATKKRKDA